MDIPSALLGLLFPVALFMGVCLAADALKNHRGTPTCAVELMAACLVLVWIAVGGTVMFGLRGRARTWVRSLPLGWRARFLLLATLLALVEEAITTTLTNLAPLFGSRPGDAFITASTNYLEVVLYHSVIVIVPMFVAWAWLLSRWAFRTGWVVLLFGLDGVLAEALLGGLGAVVMAPIWIFVYGLMIYLPAYSLPEDRGARPPRWYHAFLALVVPMLAACLMALVVNSLSPHLPHFGPEFRIPPK